MLGINEFIVRDHPNMNYSSIYIILFYLCASCNSEPKMDSPGKIYGHDMAYDESRKEVILFGGFRSNGSLIDETWIWNGNWKKLEVKGPKARKWPALVYDSKNQQIILFGGRDVSDNSLNDMWIWNGKLWNELKTETPPKRDHHRW